MMSCGGQIVSRWPETPGQHPTMAASRAIVINSICAVNGFTFDRLPHFGNNVVILSILVEVS